MKLLTLLTSRHSLLILQQLISIWFLVDFFLARDSSNAHLLWQTNQNNQEPSRIENLISEAKARHCLGNAFGEPLFEKVVLVVIDALGAEFIPAIKQQNGFSKLSDKGRRPYHMPFLEESIRQDRAMAFIARAESPTVTMPRIKALMSGTIPSFADVVYNLASDVSVFEDDNILRIARAHNRTLVFYGDDTWLSLFDRSMFKRSQETLSLFASDYTSVDTNVTTRAIPETEKSIIDWDYLILHYLGLDHIGHVFGTNEHNLIFTKLLEMDQVIKKIYNNMSLRDDKTLIVVCGDHGMNEKGNHGGDGDLEVDTAMVFLPINRDFQSREDVKKTVSRQIDFAATLSILTGLPIPQMSKGVAFYQLLSRFWSANDEYKITCTALENTRQLIALIGDKKFTNWPESLNLTRLLESHKSIEGEVRHTELADQYFSLLHQIQDKLLESIASRSNPISIVIILAFVTFLTLYNLRKLGNRFLLPVIGKFERWACLLTFTIPIIMHGSTDFIELEYYFWPAYSLIVFLLLALVSIVQNRPAASQFDNQKVALFTLFFLVTSFWNHLKSRDNSVMSVLITPAITLAILFNSIRFKSDIKYHRNKLVMGVCILIILSKYTQELIDHDDPQNLILRVIIQRVAMLAVILHTVLNILSTPSSASQQFGSSIVIYKLASGWISIAFLLSRRHNLFYLISNVILETSLNSIVNSLNLSYVSRAILYTTFAQSSFYNLGNSNSFSSIDVMPAFYGQTSYKIYWSIPLVLFATYSAQIYWIMKLLQRVQEAKTNKKWTEMESRRDCESLVMYVSDFVIARNFISLSYYMFVCLFLRNHLFIWSVISPKLLYHFVTNNVLLATVKMISNINKIKLPTNVNLHDL